MIKTAKDRDQFRGRKFGVLIVDDEEVVREVLNFGLSDSGFRVWVAANGLAAVKTFWRYRECIDLVLLDVRMPKWDGPQTLRKLRRLTTRVHCCFISGDLGWYTEDSLRAMGALAVFKKPFDIGELAKRVLEILTDPQLNPSFREVRRRIIRLGPAQLLPDHHVTLSSKLAKLRWRIGHDPLHN